MSRAKDVAGVCKVPRRVRLCPETIRTATRERAMWRWWQRSGAFGRWTRATSTAGGQTHRPRWTKKQRGRQEKRREQDRGEYKGSAGQGRSRGSNAGAGRWEGCGLRQRQQQKPRGGRRARRRRREREERRGRQRQKKHASCAKENARRWSGACVRKATMDSGEMAGGARSSWGAERTLKTTTAPPHPARPAKRRVRPRDQLGNAGYLAPIWGNSPAACRPNAGLQLKRLGAHHSGERQLPGFKTRVIARAAASHLTSIHGAPQAQWVGGVGWGGMPGTAPVSWAPRWLSSPPTHHPQYRARPIMSSGRCCSAPCLSDRNNGSLAPPSPEASIGLWQNIAVQPAVAPPHHGHY